MQAAVKGLLIGVAVAVTVGGVGALSSSAQEAPINVTATRTHFSAQGEGGFGRVGNTTQEVWRLNDRNGTHIGRMLLQCRWILTRARYCSGEIQLPLGKITVAGASATTFEGEYAVTGGTGRYRGTGGVMLFTAIGLRKNILQLVITT